MPCSCKISRQGQFLGLPDHLEPRFFTGLAKNELDLILSSARHRALASSNVVIHEGEAGQRLYLLTSGRARHFVTTSGGRKILLHWLTAGQAFGGVSILANPISYMASTEVLMDSCALVWDRKTIRDFVVRFPKLLDNALSIAVTEHIAWAVAQHVSLSSNDARQRLAHLLISLACGMGKVASEGVVLNVKNEDLASGANVTRFTASRVLNEWQRAGTLRKLRGKVLLRNPQDLMDSF